MGSPAKSGLRSAPAGTTSLHKDPKPHKSQRPFGKQTGESWVSVSIGFMQRHHSEKQPEPLTHQIRLSLLCFLFAPSSTSLSFFFFLSQLHFLLSFFILLQLCTGLSCGTRGLRCITRNLPLWHRDSPAVPLQLPSVCAQ